MKKFIIFFIAILIFTYSNIYAYPTQETNINDSLYKTTTFMLAQKKYKITIPSTWSIAQGDDYYSQFSIRFIKDNNIIAGIEFQNGLPNHSELLKSEEITSNIGKGKIYVYRLTSPAAAKIQKEWYTIIALINETDNEYPYYIFLLSKEALLDNDMFLLKNIIESIEIQ